MKEITVDGKKYQMQRNYVCAECADRKFCFGIRKRRCDRGLDSDLSKYPEEERKIVRDKLGRS